MQSDRLLAWVQANRGRRDHTAHMGASVTRYVGQLADDGDVAASLAEVVSALVDDEFRSHCRIELANGSTLVVRVNDPTLVYSMRTRWSLALTGALARADAGQRLGPRRGPNTRRIARIAFEYGLDGLSLARARQG